MVSPFVSPIMLQMEQGFMEDVRHNKCGLTSSSRAALEAYLLSIEGNMAEYFRRYIAATPQKRYERRRVTVRRYYEY